MTKECFLPDCKLLAEIVRALRIGKVEVPEAGFRKIASAGLLEGQNERRPWASTTSLNETAKFNGQPTFQKLIRSRTALQHIPNRVLRTSGMDDRR
jgi:hypothetical protein